MELTEILLIASALILLIDIIALRTKKDSHLIGDSFPTIIIAGAIIFISYVYFAFMFITNNFRFEEVFYYSSSGLSWAERLYASWASSGGSWLFFGFLFSVTFIIIRLRLGQDKKASKIYQLQDIIFLFIILVLLIQNPLKTLSFTPIEGRGLNPLLKTPWMLVHPPIVFIGYVLTLFSFSFVFWENESSQKYIKGFAGISWLTLTLGIAIGGLWAYEVLGWGGYWGWDPVETSSLVPWITLTAYFHLTTQLAGKKTWSQDFMLLVTSSLVLLASAITRGGLAVSVHAFGSSPIGYVLLTLIVVNIAYFIYYKRRRGYSLFRFETKTDTVYNTAISASYLSLIMIGVICMWGVVFPIINSGITGSDVSMDVNFFNRWTYPFVLLFLASLIGCHLYKRLNMGSYAVIVGGLFILGVVFAFLNYPTKNTLANFGIPLALFATASTLYNLVLNLTGKTSPLLVSRGFIHFGSTLIIIGILLGSSQAINYGELVGSPSSKMNVGDINLDFGAFSIIEPSTVVLTSSNPQKVGPEFAGLMIPVKATRGAETLTGEVYIMYYTLHGIVSRPTVIRSLGYDLYMVLHQSQSVYKSLGHILTGDPFAPTDFVISIIYFPMINLIWIGTLLMCVGILYPIFSIWRKTSDRNEVSLKVSKK